MTSLLRRAEQVFVYLNEMIIALMFFVMFFLVFGNVVTRYLFNFSMNWAEELARYLMIWMVYLGAGLAMREGRHIAIEVLHGLLPARIRRYVRAAIGLLMMLFMVVLAVLGYQYASFAMVQQTAALQWPAGIIYAAIPLGAIAFILHLIACFRDYVEQSLPAEQEDATHRDSPVGVGGGDEWMPLS